MATDGEMYLQQRLEQVQQRMNNYLQQRLEEKKQQMAQQMNQMNEEKQRMHIQFQNMQQQFNQGNDAGGGKKWDSLDKFHNAKIFDGSQKEFEELSNKLRSQVAAGSRNVASFMRAVEADCTQSAFAKED